MREIEVFEGCISYRTRTPEELEAIDARVEAEQRPGETLMATFYRLAEAPHHYSLLRDDEGRYLDREVHARRVNEPRGYATLSRDEAPLQDEAHTAIEQAVASGGPWWAQLNSLAGRHVVYDLFSWDETHVYVGVTSNLGRRFSQHSKKWWWMTVDPWACVFYEFITREWALRWEARVIAHEQPAMNRAGRVLIPRYLDVRR